MINQIFGLVFDPKTPEDISINDRLVRFSRGFDYYLSVKNFHVLIIHFHPKKSFIGKANCKQKKQCIFENFSSFQITLSCFSDSSNKTLTLNNVKKIIYIYLLHIVELFHFWPWVKNLCQAYHNFIFDMTHKYIIW